MSKPWAVAWLSNSEWALLLFGLVLVGGLVGEYFADHKKKEYPTFKSQKRFFEILVIVGVAGELVADGGIFIFSACLQTIADHEVAASYERAKNAEKEARNVGFLAAQIGITNTQLSLQVEQLHSTNLAFSLTVEDLRSNNLVVDKRLTDEANEAKLRAELLASNNIILSLTVENLRSNNSTTEIRVEELRKENLQIETRMINGLYSRSYFDVIPMTDTKRVAIQHKGMNTRVFILLAKAPIPISINATMFWHTGLFRGLLGTFVGGDYGKSIPIYLSYNKNVVWGNIGAPEWDRLEYPQDARFVIRYTEFQQETNLWTKVEVKGADIYFDGIKQTIP